MRTAIQINTFPAEATFVGYGGIQWNMQYYQNWRSYWSYMDENAWLSGNAGIAGRISIYVASDTGTAYVNFFDPSGRNAIVQKALYAWRPNVSTGENESIRSFGFAPSAQGPSTSGTTMIMPVIADDLLLTTGMSTNSTSGTFSLSGVTAQALVSFSASYGSAKTGISLWRIGQTGTASVSAAGYNHGRMAMKIVPYVEVVQTVLPSSPPDLDYIFVEIPAVLTSSGQVIRPRWFNSLRSTYAWDINLGVRKRWLKDAPIIEHDAPAQARLVELWKFPKAALSSIPASEAYVFNDEQTAEDRVTYYDLGW
ncbi:MAG: hypothetical protein PHZ19_11160 [Candidatus Thermoplasmatota archaeon]|nr:hypothetical protein [Candidatus Thermoplasmatota archaeon]